MSKAQWYPVTNVAEFLKAGRKVRGTHAFTDKVLHWPVCAHCGLMALRNEATRRAMKAPCETWEDT